MLETTKVFITTHALERYRERVDSSANRRTVEACVRSSSAIDKRTRQKILQQCPFNKWKYRRIDGTHVLWKTSDVVFALEVIDRGKYRVISCWKWEPTK